LTHIREGESVCTGGGIFPCGKVSCLGEALRPVRTDRKYRKIQKVKDKRASSEKRIKGRRPYERFAREG
jgi:hypothetical protein